MEDEFLAWLSGLVVEAEATADQRPEDEWWAGYVDGLNDVANKLQAMREAVPEPA